MRRIPLVLVFALPAACASAAGESEESDATVAGVGSELGHGLYPRLVRLEHNGEANGRILASTVHFAQDHNANGIHDGVGAIYESRDGGATFTRVGTVAPPNALDGKGLCCGTLYEVPRRIGNLRPGTLLWSASVGQQERGRRMGLPVWKSTDLGRTWSYVSTVAVSPNAEGLWEPEFSVAADGALVCHYSDETDPGHSQKLVAARTYDGVHWREHSETVASPKRSDRPGMPIVRRLPDGSYLMTYEICGPPGRYQCVVHTRTSSDGWDFGDPSDLGIRPETVDGKYFTHTPTIAWSPYGSPRGRILLIGQHLQNADGSEASGSGKTILVNTENGTGNWYEIAAPVEVPLPLERTCSNYSPPLLPLDGGRKVLQFAGDKRDNGCRMHFATGTAIGTGNAARIRDGATYRLVNVQSGRCLDVSADSREPGGNVQQWTCNGLGPQDWIVRSRGNGFFTLKAANSGLCLDVTGGSERPGANVQQWTCNGSAAQQWRIVRVGRGYYGLTARNSDLCLDIARGSSAPGANAQQWHCNDLAPQIWRFERR